MLSALKPAPQWSPVSQQWRVALPRVRQDTKPSFLITGLEYSQTDLTAFTKGKCQALKERDSTADMGKERQGGKKEKSDSVTGRMFTKRDLNSGNSRFIS